MLGTLAAVSVHWRVCDAVLSGASVSDLKAYHVSVCTDCGRAQALQIHACCERTFARPSSARGLGLLTAWAACAHGAVFGALKRLGNLPRMRWLCEL